MLSAGLASGSGRLTCIPTSGCAQAPAQTSCVLTTYHGPRAPPPVNTASLHHAKWQTTVLNDKPGMPSLAGSLCYYFNCTNSTFTVSFSLFKTVQMQ